LKKGIKFKLVLIISLCVGCAAAPEVPIRTTEIHKETRPEHCFYCGGKIFIPISYGTIPHPGHIFYALPVKEWRYHCVGCGKSTTGNQEKDQKLQNEK